MASERRRVAAERQEVGRGQQPQRHGVVDRPVADCFEEGGARATGGDVVRDLSEECRVDRRAQVRARAGLALHGVEERDAPSTRWVGGIDG